MDAMGCGAGRPASGCGLTQVRHGELGLSCKKSSRGFTGACMNRLCLHVGICAGGLGDRHPFRDPPRIVFSEHTCPLDCACPMTSGLPWPGSPNDSAVKPSRRSLAWSNRILFSRGMANWWHTSSTALAIAAIRADPGYCPKWKTLVVRVARENRGWGYDRIVGALANLSHARRGAKINCVAAVATPQCP
jgi:hypothetical protein